MMGAPQQETGTKAVIVNQGVKPAERPAEHPSRDVWD